LGEENAVSFTKLLALTAIAATSILADTIVFQFGGSTSSLTLAPGSTSQVQGSGRVVGVQGLPGGSPHAITGTFQFASGTRGANDISGSNRTEQLNLGGTWQLVGSGTVNGFTFQDQILLGGTFLPAQISNSSNTSAFEGTMVVGSFDSDFLNALGYESVIENSTQNVASLSRPGVLVVSNGRFINGAQGTSVPYSGTLTFEAVPLAVPEPVEISFLLLGTFGAAGLVRKRVRS
jgi:hypothetical protein